MFSNPVGILSIWNYKLRALLRQSVHNRQTQKTGCSKNGNDVSRKAASTTSALKKTICGIHKGTKTIRNRHKLLPFVEDMHTSPSVVEYCIIYEHNANKTRKFRIQTPAKKVDELKTSLPEAGAFYLDPVKNVRRSDVFI